jgi:hypothetical protein
VQPIVCRGTGQRQWPHLLCSPLITRGPLTLQWAVRVNHFQPPIVSFISKRGTGKGRGTAGHCKELTPLVLTQGQHTCSAKHGWEMSGLPVSCSYSALPLLYRCSHRWQVKRGMAVCKDSSVYKHRQGLHSTVGRVCNAHSLGPQNPQLSSGSTALTCWVGPQHLFMSPMHEILILVKRWSSIIKRTCSFRVTAQTDGPWCSQGSSVSFVITLQFSCILWETVIKKFGRQPSAPKFRLSLCLSHCNEGPFLSLSLAGSESKFDGRWSHQSSHLANCVDSSPSWLPGPWKLVVVMGAVGG